MAESGAEAEDRVDSAAARRVEIALLAGSRAPGSLIYGVPDRLSARTRPGATALVPLGPRRVLGVVLEDTQARPPAPLRDLLDIIEDAVPPDLLELALWAARYYRAPRSSLLQAVLPPALRRNRRRQVVPTHDLSLADDSSLPALTPRERDLLERLPAGGLALDALRLERGKGVDAALRRLRALGLVRIEDVEVTRREKRSALVIGPDSRPPPPRARRQCAIYALVAERAPEPVQREEIESALPGSSSAMARMIAAGRLVEVSPSEPRLLEAPSFALHPEQAEAVTAIDAAHGSFAPFLLHGVTSSGKTEVYLDTALRARARGCGVLILVPEIGLTPQLVEHARRRFGTDTYVLHSGLTAGARAHAWREVAALPHAVVIGARSAVFAPIRALGLIVVDEEHDSAYKQEESPRYHARDVAVMRAKLCSCPVVLASATPSLESYQAARRGRYRLLELPLRANRRPLPSVELIDLRAGRDSGEPASSGASSLESLTRSTFSPELVAALQENLHLGEQSLLFLNRRGFERFVQCEACGHVETCPQCSVSLTFHRARHAAVCHHCGFGKTPATRCPGCATPLRARSFGTEQVEAIVRSLLPTARVARLDSDTSSSHAFVRETMDAWRRGELDILVGTQMIAKGHDAPGVTLIGVVLADTALSFPDFRAAERTFQLLTQVAGRAGRGDRPGRVLVQTRQPEHPSLIAAKRHDYGAFAEAELALRQMLLYPPFGRLARLVVEGRDLPQVEHRATRIAERLRHVARGDLALHDVDVLGPAPAPIERLRGRHRQQILVKATTAPRLATTLRAAAPEEQGDRAVRVVIDVDPINML